ncbi:hypothetical protein E2C01_050218 [Portunus trituberculatus]|uniref:Uncharacterized protein n=1 Tax=Portunus trituberculatus TaxID=210409 RepID=A0A5B7GFV4_PORTR|nr:hypothetical protein [Portunus trituberculatus]
MADKEWEVLGLGRTGGLGITCVACGYLMLGRQDCFLPSLFAINGDHNTAFEPHSFPGSLAQRLEMKVSSEADPQEGFYGGVRVLEGLLAGSGRE